MPCRFKSGFGYQYLLKGVKVDKNLSQNEQNDFVSLLQFFKILNKYKTYIFVITFLFSIMSVFYSLSLPNKFSSEISLKVMLNQDSEESRSYGGISSLIGLSNSSNNDAEMLKSMILSKSFAKNLITHEGVLESIIATKSYDKKSRSLIYDDEVYDHEKKKWVRDVNYPFSKIPSYLELHNAYIDFLKVNINELSGLMEISFTHISPEFANYFVNLVVNEANLLMKNKHEKESEKALEYLNKELIKSTKLEVKKAIGSIVETQLKKQMIIKISDEYALNTVNASFIPELKSSPNRAFICILGTFIGFIMSIFFIMIYEFFITNKYRS